MILRHCYSRSGLSRLLRASGIEILEVGRPKRRDQHRSGKSAPIDAELAARAVLAGIAIGDAKDTEGTVEMIRVLRAARRSAVKARAQAAKQLKGLLITAPEGLRVDLRGLSTAKLVRTGRPPSVQGTFHRTSPRPPSSPSAPSPAVTRSSRKRSASSTASSSDW